MIDQLHTIFVKFLSKEASEEETQLLEKFLENPQNKEEFQEFAGLWFSLQRENSKIDKTKARGRYKAFLDKEIALNRKRRIRKLQLSLLTYAALFVGIGLGAYFILNWSPQEIQQVRIAEDLKIELPKQQEAFIKTEEGEIILLSNQASKSLKASDGTEIKKEEGERVIYQDNSTQESKAVMHELGVPRGKRIDLILADGTKVWLNSESVLKFPTRFDGKQRVVQLEGEAYFEVAENAHQPFIVKTSDLNVRVLGTHFNVCSYQAAKTIDMALVEGKVAFYSISKAYEEDNAVLLRPNQRAVFDKRTSHANIERCNAKNYCSWHKGVLVFDKEPFSRLKTRLERWYDIDIQNDNLKLEQVAFSGKFDNEDIAQVMRVLQKNAGIDYEKNGKIIRILP